ncbi:hypothetical protein A3731_31960 [Roseovarius sp. HI0049]|nr:hypothetical protein A3731_31960 [Roseovarius sp. HI0049]
MECQKPDGEMMGESGIASVAAELKDAHGAEYLQSLVWRLADITGSDQFGDDVSAVLLEFNGRSQTC